MVLRRADCRGGCRTGKRAVNEFIRFWNAGRAARQFLAYSGITLLFALAGVAVFYSLV